MIGSSMFRTSRSYCSKATNSSWSRYVARSKNGDSAMRNRIEAVVEGWIDRQYLDLLIVGFAVAAQYRYELLPLVGVDERGSWVQTLAASSGILLSLATIVITLVLSVTPSARLHYIIIRFPKTLHGHIVIPLGFLVLCTLGFTSLYWLDRSKHGDLEANLSVALISLTLIKFARIWWVISQMIRSLIASQASPDLGQKESWERPRLAPGDYARPSDQRDSDPNVA